jgi:hypothetical protein
MACAECGMSLPASNRAMVVPCDHCEAVWKVTRGGLQRFQAYYAEPQQTQSKLVWLPFWHVESEVAFAGQ